MRPKSKKILLRAFYILLLFFPSALLAHYIIFPQQTRSILVDYSDFKKNGRLYYNQNTPQSRIDSLKSLIEKAGIRVALFAGKKSSDSKIIYCETEVDFKRFGSADPVPAVTLTKLGAHIALSRDAADIDIIAHEIVHAELYERVGFYNWSFKIPMWFKQGLAMQCDYRNYYSEDTLQVRSDNYKNMPDVKSMSDAQFYEGSTEQIMLNYMVAKHELKSWYTKEKFDTFVDAMNDGKNFEEAYGR